MQTERPKYNNALLIGCGGTGIKTLRFIKAQKGDNPLANMIKLGSIQLVAIDSDSKSNAHVDEVDANLTHRDKSPVSQQEPSPTKLPVIDEWVLINREEINNAMPQIRESVRRMHEQGFSENDMDKPIHSHIARWFPRAYKDEGIDLTEGHSSSAGAAQWRPLGRVGVFLNAHTIKSKLKAAYQKARQDNQPVKVYVICSLAGGTGSGMFWDIGFLLNLIDSRISATGVFLLDGPYDKVDQAYRIAPNVYGALKELVHYKNWIQKDNLTVTYPIGDSGMTFKAKQGSKPVFGEVYIYQGFNSGDGVKDKNTSDIDATCFRISQNVLAQLRTDIHQLLDVGKNNIHSDTTSMRGSDEVKFVFSTSSTTSFDLEGTKDIKLYLMEHWKKHQLHNVSEERITYIGSKSFWEGQLIEKEEDNEESEEWTLKTFNKYIIAELKKTDPESLDNIKQKAQQGLQEIEAAKGNKEIKLNDLVELFQKFISVEVLRQWDIMGNTGFRFPIDFSKNYELKIEKKIQSLVKKLKEFNESLKDENKILTPNLFKQIELLADFVEKAKEVDQLPEIILIIDKPPRYYYIKSVFSGPRILRILANILRRAMLRSFRLEDYFDLVKTALIKVIEEIEQKHSINENDLLNLLRFKMNENSDELLKQLNELIEKQQYNLDLKKHRQTIEREFKSDILDEDEIEEPNFLRMNSLYSAIARDEGLLISEREAKYKEMYENLQSIIKKTLKDHHKILVHKDNLPPCLVEETFTDSLFHFYDKLIIEENKENEKKLELFREFIYSLLPNWHAIVNLKLRTEHLKEAASLIIGDMINYWTEHSNWLLQQAGGEDGIKSRIKRCTSEVFRKKRRHNTLAKEHLVIIPPKKLEWEHGFNENYLTFKRVTTTILQIEPVVSSNTEFGPIIYYEDLFRGAEEIAGIERFAESYLNRQEKERPFFHFDKAAAELPEIVGVARGDHPVYCGNSDCSYDIRHVNRTTKICPDCHNPIWNWCGNQECQEDELLKHIKKIQEQSKDSNPPHHCPICHNKLKTYWWRCTEKEHRDKAIPADKEYCPECVQECNQNIRREKDVQKRFDKKNTDCPGCKHLKQRGCSDHIVEIPNALNEFYENGVNGHDSIRFRKEVINHKVDKHVCKNEVHRHFHFPTCPESEEDSMHHLYKNRYDRFVCPEHSNIKFFECFGCGYPVRYDADSLMRGEKVRCPRCLKHLKKCIYCSDKFNTLYAPYSSKYPNIDRCPRCKNLMDANTGYNTSEVLKTDLEHPAFCHNLFNCNAGKAVWYTATEFDEKDCVVCNGPVGKLLDREDLERHIQKCPICLILLGLNGNGSDEVKDERTIVLNELSKDPILLNNDQEYCKICGCRPTTVFKWMVLTDFFGNETSAVEVEEKLSMIIQEYAIKNGLAEIIQNISKNAGSAPHIPSIPFEEGIFILDSIMKYFNDIEAYRVIKKRPSFYSLNKEINEVSYELLKVFRVDAIAAKGLEKRLYALESINKQHREREEQSVQTVNMKNLNL